MGSGALLLRRRWRLLLPLLAFCVSTAAHALSLGNITVHSTLGKPFVADIPLKPAAGEALPAALQVGLASRADYRRLGLSYLPALTQLSVDAGHDAAGRPRVQIRSQVPVRASTLQLLLDIHWDGGHLMREYVVQLGSPAPQMPVGAAKPQPSTAEPVMYGPVKAGEMLSEIAHRFKPLGVSTPQMTVAIFQANPHAFVDGNMNRLRRGVSLFLPSDQAARAVTRQQAAAVIRAQSQPRPAAASPTASGPAKAASTLQILAPVTPSPGGKKGELQRRLDKLRRSNAEIEAENRQLRTQLARLERQTRQLAAKVLAQPAPSAARTAAPHPQRPVGVTLPAAVSHGAKPWWRQPFWWVVVLGTLLGFAILVTGLLWLRRSRPPRYRDLLQTVREDDSVQFVWRGRL